MEPALAQPRKWMNAGVALTLLVIAACSGDGGTAPTVPDSVVTDPSTPASDSTAASITTTSTAAAATVPVTDAPPPIELAGTRWNVTEYSQGAGTITNVWKTDVTLEFGDGTFSGSSGCNTYSGRWTAEGAYDEFESGQPDVNDGQMLVFTDLAWTEIGCEDVDIMEQEVEILDLLQRAGRWVLIRDDFNLRDAEGAYLFNAEPAP